MMKKVHGGAPPKQPTTPAPSPRFSLHQLPDVPADQKWVMKAGDSLWGLARGALGEKAPDTEVQALVTAMLKENPALNTPTRKHGNLMYPADEVKKPKPGSWGPKPGPPGGASPPPAAEAPVEAPKTPREVELSKELATLHALAEQVRQVRDGDPRMPHVEVVVRKTLQMMSPELRHTPESHVLRAWLPAGDPLKRPTLTAEQRMNVARRFDAWAQEAQSRQMGRDERLHLGAQIDAFPEMVDRPSVQQLRAHSPISPAQAEQELAVDLKHMATKVATTVLSESERVQVGDLIKLILGVAPRLQFTTEFDSLKAHAPKPPTQMNE